MAERQQDSTSPHAASDVQSSRPASSGSGQTYTLTPTPTPTLNTSHVPVYKPDSLLHNKMDERQRLAKERREERERQSALREAAWQQREERARQHYDKTLEERRRRGEETRRKEERRRSAVEEKRRAKMEEDKVRHEAVIRRTMEKSQRGRNKTNRWSWGGPVPHTHSGFAASDFLYPLDLAGLEPHRRHGTSSQYADRNRKCVSTVNLTNHSADRDDVITKRLSRSSATLLHSPDRGLRGLPLTPWENNMVNRLQQPTHSYLARSRSAVSLTGDTHTVLPVCPRSVSCQPMGSLSFKTLQSQPRPLPHCRHDRNLSGRRPEADAHPMTRRKTASGATPPQRDSSHHVRKSWSNLSVAPCLSLPPSPCLSLLPSKAPGKRKSKGTTPSPGRPPHRPPTPRQLRSPGGGPEGGAPEEELGNIRPVRPPTPEEEGGVCSVHPPTEPRPQPLGENVVGGEQQRSASGLQRPRVVLKEAGTTDPEEASRPVPQTGTTDPEEPSGYPVPGTTDPEEARVPAQVQRPSAGTTDPEETRGPVQVQRPSPGTTDPEEARGPVQVQRPSAGTTDPEEAGRILAEKRRQAREQREREDEERRTQEERARMAQEASERARRQGDEETRREEARRAEEESARREREEAERLHRQEEEEGRQKEEAERLRLEREKHFRREEEERLERKKRLEEIMKRTRRSDTTHTQKVPPHRNGEDAGGAVASASQQQSNSNGHTESHPAPSAALTPSGRSANGEDFEEVIQLPDGTDAAPPHEGARVPVVAFRENGLLKEDRSTHPGADAV